MADFCEFFSTEYSRNFRKKKIQPAEIIYHKDYFTDRIEEGEIDPRIASIPTQLDEAAEQLVHKHILDRLQSVYKVTYKHPKAPRDTREVGEEIKEKDLQSELVAYIHDLYFNPQDKKVLAPPVTAKRMLGYIRPKLLHGDLSIYQDTFSRTGATIIIGEHEKKKARTSKNAKIPKDPCADIDYKK